MKITPEEIIQQALAGNAGLVERSRTRNRNMLEQRAATPPTIVHGATVKNNSPLSSPEGTDGPGDLGDGDDTTTPSGLQAQFESALNKMIAESGGKIKINSGYRSVERQAELWEQALKKYGSPEKARKWVAPPGKSNHNHGKAADLGYADNATRQWAHQNAARFGLHFPLSNENWHIEPVGSRG